MMTTLRSAVRTDGGGGCACRRRASKFDAAVAETEARLMAPLFKQKTAKSHPGRCARLYAVLYQLL
eukprot:COSAG02_NODE_161_length_32629_cov_10.363142_22_plen_66_part_00